MMRIFEVMIALTCLVLASPILLILMLAIYIEDRGPIFFLQKRYGKDKKEFSVIKLRTMRDQKVTQVGRFIRATGLDEVVQCVNVIQGDMSLVGPRPLTEYDVIRLKWDGSDVEDRWDVKPGITGFAQVLGGHSARVSLFLDRKWIQQRDFSQWLYIMFVSAAVAFMGKRGVRRWLRGR